MTSNAREQLIEAANWHLSKVETRNKTNKWNYFFLGVASIQVTGALYRLIFTAAHTKPPLVVAVCSPATILLASWLIYDARRWVAAHADAGEAVIGLVQAEPDSIRYWHHLEQAQGAYDQLKKLCEKTEASWGHRLITWVRRKITKN